MTGINYTRLYVLRGEILFFDIHSHILPAVDDGAADLKEAIRILKLMQQQGITHVLATPHFYPTDDNIDDFKTAVDSAFELLKKEAKKRKLPKIYLGCEMLYFEGIGHSKSLSGLCLNNSDVLLLEITDECIDDELFKNILEIRNNLGLTPIIAHVERYFMAKKYRRFLKFLGKERIMVQINASSVLIPAYKRTIKKLLKSRIFCVLGTDSHSVEGRPPMLDKALESVVQKYGESYKNKLIKNANLLFEKIVLSNEG